MAQRQAASAMQDAPLFIALIDNATMETNRSQRVGSCQFQTIVLIIEFFMRLGEADDDGAAFHAARPAATGACNHTSRVVIVQFLNVYRTN